VLQRKYGKYCVKSRITSRLQFTKKEALREKKKNKKANSGLCIAHHCTANRLNQQSAQERILARTAFTMEAC